MGSYIVPHPILMYDTVHSLSNVWSFVLFKKYVIIIYFIVTWFINNYSLSMT